MKRVHTIASGLIITYITLPLFVFAQTTSTGKVTLKSLMSVAADYMDTALKLLMGFAVLMFVWYIIQYFIRSGDEKKRKEAGQYLLWSLFGFFVILSMWGLVNVLVSTFNLGSSSAPSWSDVSNLFPRK